MRLGMLTQWYDPETGPASLPGVYAREFVKQGHEVKVLTGFPNYPDGKLYPGYRLRPRLRESRGKICVTRVALFPSHSKSAPGRILNYTTFALSASTLGMGALKDIDALWVYNSPITVALPMLMHTRFGRTPIFLHVQDLWPDSLIESGMFPDSFSSRQISRAIAGLVRFTERHSAVIGVISESVRELLLERNPRLHPSKIVYVPNPTNEQMFLPVDEIRQKLGISPRPGVVEFMYAGAIGEVQGLDTLLDAAEMLRERPDIQITLVGDGISRQRLEQRVSKERLTNVRFLGRVTQDEIPALIARADVQLVSLASKPFLRHTTPSKISSLLASGVPLVAQIEGDGAKLLRQSGAALVAQPGSAEDLARAICKMVDDGQGARANMGLAGLRFYKECLSAEAAAATITAALASVVSRSK